MLQVVGVGFSSFGDSSHLDVGCRLHRFSITIHAGSEAADNAFDDCSLSVFMPLEPQDSSLDLVFGESYARRSISVVPSSIFY